MIKSCQPDIDIYRTCIAKNSYNLPPTKSNDAKKREACELHYGLLKACIDHKLRY